MYKLLNTPVITTKTYIVDNSFYLVVPKMVSIKDIEVMIAENVNEQMQALSNTDKITIIRPLSKEFLDKLSDVRIRYQLKAHIQKDLQATRLVLNQEGIKYGDNVSIKSFDEGFAKWYQDEEQAHKTQAQIWASGAKPEEVFRNTSEELVAVKEKKQQLVELREQAIQAVLNLNTNPTDSSKSESASKGEEKGKSLVLSNGKSLEPDKNGQIVFNDGFINILLLSFVTAFVTIGTVVAMLYILR